MKQNAECRCEILQNLGKIIFFSSFGASVGYQLNLQSKFSKNSTVDVGLNVLGLPFPGCVHARSKKYTLGLRFQVLCSRSLCLPWLLSCQEQGTYSQLAACVL